jgi:hypothetical protein
LGDVRGSGDPTTTRGGRAFECGQGGDRAIGLDRRRRLDDLVLVTHAGVYVPSCVFCLVTVLLPLSTALVSRGGTEPSARTRTTAFGLRVTIEAFGFGVGFGV